VNAVAGAEFHGLIDFAEDTFVEREPVAGRGVAAIVHRQPHEVEAELGPSGP
jgi:hypothetical protein